MSLPTLHPATRLAGHLMWTRHGTCWAMWRLDGMRYGGTLEDKRLVVAAHKALVRAIGAEAMLLSVMLPENPATIVERMIEGVDLEECPLWVEECEHTLDSFDELPIGERLYWLAIPLANHRGERFKEPWHAVEGRARSALDLPPRPLPEVAIQDRALQASKLEELIPPAFAPHRVSPAEHVWLWNHHSRRGQVEVPPPSQDDSETAMRLLHADSGSAFTPRYLDEGARSDEDAASRADLLGQRVLKVVDPVGEELGLGPSYQALMAVADTPTGGIRWPGSEWLMSLDAYGIDVDWVLRMRVNPREKVLAANRAALRRINEQYSQRDMETSSGPHELNIAATMLRSYEQLFADDRQEVEVEHTAVLAVSATPEALRDGIDEHGETITRVETGREVIDRVTTMATRLAKTVYNDLGLRLERLPGKQQELWWAMVPGVPRSSLVKAYTHITTSRKMAMMVPLTARRLGGRSGPVPFLCEETSRPLAVHVDPAGYPELNLSGSMLVCAELGAGKSVWLKTCCHHLVARGGRFYAIDGDAGGEWARFATGSFDDAVVVAVQDPQWTMDPLRLFGPEAGVSMLHTLLTMLFRIQERVERSALGRLCSTAYLEQHHLSSLADIAAHVQAGAFAHDGAASLAGAFAEWRDNPLAQVLFDPALPAPPLERSAVVFRTYGITLPTAVDIDKKHLFDEMAPTKILGRAYYRLLTQVGRHLCFADPSVATALVTDELHRMANPENLEDLEHFLREGRRPKALLWGGTHDIADVIPEGGDKEQEETIASLVPTRLVMRMGSRPMARRAVSWLGIDPESPEFDAKVKLVLEGLSPKDKNGSVPANRRGEGILRDGFGEIGVGRVLLPATPRAADAVLTTPPSQRTG